MFQVYSKRTAESCFRLNRPLPSKEKSSDLHRLADLATRKPATYAILSKVFAEISFPETVLDYGADPGTPIWALRDTSLKKLTLIEKDFEFVKLGKKLAPETPFEVTWGARSFLNFSDRAELILFSYSLNEIPEELLGKDD